MNKGAATVIELACVAAIAVGVALIYVPAALIIGGLLVLTLMQGIAPRRERGA